MSGVVLAGGRSARMGRDKAELPYGGGTLLEHVVSLVRQVERLTIVVAATRSQYALRDDTHVLGDLYPGAGPVGGIVTALEALPDDYTLVAACDMPRLRPEVLRFLLEQARGYDAAVPMVGGRLEPLCAAYHQRCANPLRAALEEGERAAHRAVRRLRLNVVPEEALRALDPLLESFTNVNAPDDLARVARSTREAS